MFYATLRTLAAIFEAAVPMPKKKEEVVKNLRHSSKNYEEVQFVLDPTELEVEKCQCAWFCVTPVMREHAQ